MQLQTMPAPGLCAATSFAMALDMSVDDLLAWIGHDGSEIIFPDLPPPLCRRGHHIQELIEAALVRGKAVTPVELFPVIGSFPDAKRTRQVLFGEGFTGNWIRFNQYLTQSRGTIEGTLSLVPHMVAYEHGRIYDPNGHVYEYSREACERRGFITRSLWRVDDIEPTDK